MIALAGMAMRCRLNKRRLTAMTVVWALTVGATARGEVFCAGNDKVLWVVWSTVIPDQEYPLVRMAYTGSDPASFRVPLPQPRLGTVRYLAVQQADLHLIYGGGAHHRYNSRGDFVELSVPGDFTWAAAGDTARNAIYVIVARSAAEQLVELHAQAAPQTQPAFEAVDQPDLVELGREQALLTAHPDARRWLVEYAAGRWRLFAPLPNEYVLAQVGHCWMAADDGDIHLAWKPEAEHGPVMYGERSTDKWSAAAPIPGTEKTIGGALLLFDDVTVFAAFVPDDKDAAKLNVQPFRATKGQWEAAARLNTEHGPLRASPARIAVAAFRKQIAVAVETDDANAPVQVGLWPSGGGKPATPFAPLTTLMPRPKSWIDRHWSDTTSLLVLLAIIAILFWLRQDCLLLNARLEDGYTLASHGRRVLGFVIDLAPAWIVTLPLWAGPLWEVTAALREHADASDEQLQQAALMSPLWLPWLATRLVYAGYCMAFELLRGSTPGKMAMRCAVRRMDGARPGWGRILIRNLTRVIELEPLLYIWPMLLLVLMTRNRQRVGDLLARTVVVHYRGQIDATQSTGPPAPSA